MMHVSAQVGPVIVRIETDEGLHPEFFEMLMTRCTVQASILHNKMLKDAAESSAVALGDVSE